MKIPEDRKPYEVIINGVKKTYEGGATVADDASVKEIIDNADTFPPEALPVETPFPIPEQSGGTNVVANPTLAGDEDSLTGIQIGDTKYAVGGGSSGGGVLVIGVTPSGDKAILDKTWQEIYDAADANIIVAIGNRLPLYFASISDDGGYIVHFSSIDQELGIFEFATDSASGYPSITFGG